MKKPLLILLLGILLLTSCSSLNEFSQSSAQEADYFYIIEKGHTRQMTIDNIFKVEYIFKNLVFTHENDQILLMSKDHEVVEAVFGGKYVNIYVTEENYNKFKKYY